MQSDAGIVAKRVAPVALQRQNRRPTSPSVGGYRCTNPLDRTIAGFIVGHHHPSRDSSDLTCHGPKAFDGEFAGTVVEDYDSDAGAHHPPLYDSGSRFPACWWFTCRRNRAASLVAS